MATKETPPPPPAPAGEPPKKKRGKLLIIIGAALVLVIGIATTAVLLLKPPPSDDEEVSEEKPKKTKKEEKAHAPPAYLTLEPFVVNLTSESGEQYLQAGLTLEFDDGKEADTAKLFTPKIRNQVMLLLSGKKPADLASKEGKEKLAAEIRKDINEVLDPGEKDESKAPLKAVLFTSFIIQ